MPAEFVFPEWMMPKDEPTRAVPADPHRVAHMVNRFIAAKQDALYEAPDAFYRRKGGDALANELAVAARLTDLRDAALRQASDEDRPALAAQLEGSLPTRWTASGATWRRSGAGLPKTSWPSVTV
jgi:hypothetical protein